MKKILSLLAAIGLTATTASVVVSCQTEISGQTLQDLADKFNPDHKLIPQSEYKEKVSAQELKDQVVVGLTKVLVDQYKMDEEGYFRDSKITDLTIGDIDILVSGELKNVDTEFTEKELEGEKTIKLVIDEVQFNFQMRFSFILDGKE